MRDGSNFNNIIYDKMKLSARQLCFPLQLAFILHSAASFGVNRSSSAVNRQFVTSLASEPTEVTVAEAIEDNEPSAPQVRCPNCDLCDGSGRIMGGLGAISLFSWWPIKAYR